MRGLKHYADEHLDGVNGRTLHGRVNRNWQKEYPLYTGREGISMLESVFEVRLKHGTIRFFMLFFFGALVVTEGAVVIGVAIFGAK